jgi:hypothetical protein
MPNIKLEKYKLNRIWKRQRYSFYVETDGMNRPFKVKQLNIVTMAETTIFIDHD